MLLKTTRFYFSFHVPCQAAIHYQLVLDQQKDLFGPCHKCVSSFFVSFSCFRDMPNRKAQVEFVLADQKRGFFPPSSAIGLIKGGRSSPVYVAVVSLKADTSWMSR